MATTDITVTPEMAEKMKNALMQIGTDMLSIHAMLDDISAKGGFDHECAAIEVISARSGALADDLNKRLGGTQCVGDIANWFNRI